MLMFERDKQARLLRQIQLSARHNMVTSFRMPHFTKEFAFALLVAFQFFLSMAYLTPIYFMERKPKSIVFSFFYCPFLRLVINNISHPSLHLTVPTPRIVYGTYIGLSKQTGAAINGWFNGASFAARILSGLLADFVTTDIVLLICIWVNTLSISVLWTFSREFPIYLTFAIVYGMSFSGTSTVTPVMIANYYGKELGKKKLSAI